MAITLTGRDALAPDTEALNERLLEEAEEEEEDGPIDDLLREPALPQTDRKSVV